MTRMSPVRLSPSVSTRRTVALSSTTRTEITRGLREEQASRPGRRSRPHARGQAPRLGEAQFFGVAFDRHTDDAFDQGQTYHRAPAQRRQRDRLRRVQVEFMVVAVL